MVTYSDIINNKVLRWEWGEATLDGWGLDPQLLSNLSLYLDNAKRVLEFGSGSSTDFILKYREKHNLNYSLDSFDHNEDYAFQPDKEYDKFKLNIRKLIQYENGLEGLLTDDGKKVDVPLESYSHTRLEDSFYDIKEGDLSGHYDVIIVDGPNGNGRGFSFDHFKNHVLEGTIIFIDDFHHHPFLAYCNMVLDTRVIYHKNDKDYGDLHGYVILEVM